MSDRILSRILLLVFLSALGFIFAPVFSGTMVYHDDIDIAIPEQGPLFKEPGSVQFREDDTGRACEEFIR